MAFKIKSFKEAGINEKEDRFAVVATNGKVICDCFGVGFCNKQAAYDGFKIFNRNYKRWQTYQRKIKYENSQI